MRLTVDRRAPNQSDDSILRASLARDEDAAIYWRRWLSTNRLENVDRPTFALLPLVYRNLSAQGYTGPELGKLGGIYRQAWYRNQLLIDFTGRLMTDLDPVEMAPIVFDDLALLGWGASDPGERIIDHARVLVPAPKVVSVLQRAQALGWELSNGDYPDLDIHRSKALTRPEGIKLEVHWYLAGRHRYSGVSDPCWEASRRGWGDYPELRTLSVSDQLLSSIVAGCESGPERLLHWIPDVVEQVRSAAVDWERLVTMAAETGKQLVVRDGLEIVSGFSDEMEVPAAVMQRFGEVSRRDRIEHWFRGRSSAEYPWRTLPASWYDYRHRMADDGRRAGPIGFSRHMARRWGGESFPRAAAARARHGLRSEKPS